MICALIWTSRKEAPTQDWGFFVFLVFFFYLRASSSQLRMQAASHLELHSCMQQFKNGLVGLQCANFSHLQPFPVLQPVALRPAAFSSGSRSCCRGDHYHSCLSSGQGKGWGDAGLDSISCRALSRPGAGSASRSLFIRLLQLQPWESKLELGLEPGLGVPVLPGSGGAGGMVAAVPGQGVTEG